jgi:hypothetical protein
VRRRILIGLVLVILLAASAGIGIIVADGPNFRDLRPIFHGA